MEPLAFLVIVSILYCFVLSLCHPSFQLESGSLLLDPPCSSTPSVIINGLQLAEMTQPLDPSSSQATITHSSI